MASSTHHGGSVGSARVSLSGGWTGVGAALLLLSVAAPSRAAHDGDWTTLLNAGVAGQARGWDVVGASGKLVHGGGTHLALMRGSGDTSWVIHWHQGAHARLWRVTSPGDTAIMARNVPLPLDSIAPWDSTEIFCSGHAHLPDGKLLVVGGTASAEVRMIGSVGSKHTVTYDPITHSWAFRDSNTQGRWYPSVTALGDGRVLTTGGKLSRPVTIFGGRQGGAVSQDLRSGATSIYAGTPGSVATTGTHVLWGADAGVGPNPRATAREGHSLVYYAPFDRYFIWGGLTASGDTVRSDSVYIAIGTHENGGKQWQWSRIESLLPDPDHGKPLARGWHSTSLMGDTLVIFGGVTAGGTALNDLWMLDSLTAASPSKPQWKRLTSGSGPSARYGHAAVVDLSDPAVPRLLMQGGRENGTTLAAPGLWMATLPRLGGGTTPTWSEPAVSGGPGPREGHVAVLDSLDRKRAPPRRRIFFHGGANASTVLDSLWILTHPQFSFDSLAWTAATQHATSKPFARWRHSAVHEREWDRFRLFGGRTTLSGGERNDFWQFSMGTLDSSTFTWGEEVQQNPPAARSGHVMVEDTHDLFVERHERYEPSTGDWTQLGSSADRMVRMYPMMYSLRSGDVFYAGNSRYETPRDTNSWVLCLPEETWSNSKASPLFGGSSFVETRRDSARDKVMKCGGSAMEFSGASIHRANNLTAVSRVDSASGATTWTSTTPMDMPEERRWHNLTILPNAKVLVTGGFDDNTPPDTGARKRPYLWSPKSQVWENPIPSLEEEPFERRYHSTALLLPDGRVLTASGLYNNSPDPPNQATIYSPPYLFENDFGGSPIRPVITSVPASAIEYCQAFTVGVDSAASKIDTVCIIRPGSVTHGFNMGQRYVALPFSVESSTSLVVRMTQNANLAPPGDWMLFLLRDGVPSAAKWIRLARDHPDGGAPAAVTGLNADLTTSSGIWVSWVAPGDDGNTGGATEYDLRYSTSEITEANFSSATGAATSGPKCAGEYEVVQVGGLQCNTSYWFALRTRDEQGNWSGMSNVAEGYQWCGGGFLRADGGEESVDPALLDGLDSDGPYSRTETESTSEGGAGLVVSRRAEGVEWIVREGHAHDGPISEITAAGDIVMQVPQANGSIATAFYPLGPNSGTVRLRLPASPEARFFLAGDYSIERVEKHIRPSGSQGRRSLSRAMHSRLGDLTDAAGSVDLQAGDSVTFAYAADSSEATGTDHYFVVSRPSGSLGTTRAQRRGSGLPGHFALHQNQPNPFTLTTRLRFDLPRAETVTLEVLDLQGRRVIRWARRAFPAGRHAMAWDGRTQSGARAPPGVYLYRIAAGAFHDRKKLVVLP